MPTTDNLKVLLVVAVIVGHVTLAFTGPDEQIAGLLGSGVDSG